jgi:hypothetical protein
MDDLAAFITALIVTHDSCAGGLQALAPVLRRMFGDSRGAAAASAASADSSDDSTSRQRIGEGGGDADDAGSPSVACHEHALFSLVLIAAMLGALGIVFDGGGDPLATEAHWQALMASIGAIMPSAARVFQAPPANGTGDACTCFEGGGLAVSGAVHSSGRVRCGSWRCLPRQWCRMMRRAQLTGGAGQWGSTW